MRVCVRFFGEFFLYLFILMRVYSYARASVSFVIFISILNFIIFIFLNIYFFFHVRQMCTHVCLCAYVAEVVLMLLLYDIPITFT